jgi:hypothetical protein
MPIGKKMGSIKVLKESLKSGGGSGTFIKFIPKDGSMTVRFLEDPEEWINYVEHYDEVLRKSFPCVEANCPGCATDSRKSSRYLANAVDIENDRVVPLQLPKTLVSSLVAMYDRMGTMLDRDFELIRSGEGLDTTYSAIPDAPLPRKMTKYTPHDLEQVLDDAWKAMHGIEEVDDDDDEDVEPVAKQPKPAKKVAPRKKSKAAKKQVDHEDVAEPEFTPDVDDDDDEDMAPTDASVEDIVANEDDEDDVAVDDDDDYITEAELKAMDLGPLRAFARECGVNTKGMSKPQIIEAIMEPEEEF